MMELLQSSDMKKLENVMMEIKGVHVIILEKSGIMGYNQYEQF